MEFMPNSPMNTAPAMHMPMPMAMPISMPNAVAPISSAPNKPHHANVSVNYVNVHAMEEEHCHKPAYNPVGIYLVLFILLVIISRPWKC
jgi:hypothetical protein